MNDVKQFPIQTGDYRRRTESAKVPEPVYMAAYEVYCHVHAPQEALITGGCRGGFSDGELVAFLYARSFPKSEWADRAEEAFRGSTL